MNAFWFRRDLRLDDNAGLYHALKSGEKVLPVFIFDTEILDKLENKTDARVEFIHQALIGIQQQLTQLGSTLYVRYGKPEKVWKELIAEHHLKNVYANHDYEPYAKERDNEIAALLKKHDVGFHTYKDQVIFEKDEVLKDDGTPFVVYTPYSKKWLAKMNDFYFKSYPTEKYIHNFHKASAQEIISLEEIGFTHTQIKFPPIAVNEKVVMQYHETRDIPSVDGTSRMSVHLRFGTISVRKLATTAKRLNQKYLNELIWREFYQTILWHFPRVVNSSFRPEYDRIEWRNNEKEFEQWCQGNTGVPLVDAGMRELNATGHMHNRVRMVVASFLCKDLLIDWRWGEAYFAEKLLDFDLASNNGGWQWAAGTGVDAAPYFRVFNPTLQANRFDPKGEYIRKWVPEFDSLNYGPPMVDHAMAKERCLKVYKQALNPNG